MDEIGSSAARRPGVCDQCIEWGGKRWHRYKSGYYERTDKSVRPKRTLRLHRVVWEAANGPIPAGHDVHQADEDKGNNDLGNLECLPHGAHRAHHTAAQPIPRRDWADVVAVDVPCADCGEPVARKQVRAEVVCKRCQQLRGDAKRVTNKTCQHCQAPFRSRAGNFCSQRCVNLATSGATVRVLPEGRRRA